MASFLKIIRTNIITGFIILIPIVTSIYVLFKLFIWMDSALPALIHINMPIGIGLIFTLTFAFFVGLVTKNYIGKKVLSLGNALIGSIPVLNKIHLTIQQIMDVVVNPKKNFMDQVVLVEYPKEDSWCIGFVTTRVTPEISEAIGEEMICVYVPTTPNPTSGFMLYVPERQTRKVNLSSEVAIKAIVSAGIVSSQKTNDITGSEGNLASLLKKWRTSKHLRKKAVVDPRD